MQAAGVEQATSLRLAWALVPVVAPEGSGARVAVQVPPESVSISPAWLTTAEVSYPPTATHEPGDPHETASSWAPSAASKSEGVGPARPVHVVPFQASMSGAAPPAWTA